MDWEFSQAFIAKKYLTAFRERMHRNPKTVDELLRVLRIPSIQHASIKKSFKTMEEEKKRKERLFREDIKGI